MIIFQAETCNKPDSKHAMQDLEQLRSLRNAKPSSMLLASSLPGTRALVLTRPQLGSSARIGACALCRPSLSGQFFVESPRQLEAACELWQLPTSSSRLSQSATARIPGSASACRIASEVSLCRLARSIPVIHNKFLDAWHSIASFGQGPVLFGCPRVSRHANNALLSESRIKT